ATFVTYLLIPIGQKILRPTLVSMYSYVQPIVAIVVSICVGMDTLTWQKIVAAITVFSGVVLVSFSKKRG
ncbi:MAG: EamA family transporter, partial [Alistipes sp.]|nr:EamA family transporter [Alistipes sp.]